MNKKQLFVLWVTIGILALISMFPVRQAGTVGERNFYRARGFFLNQRLENSPRTYYYTNIDLETMIAQMIAFAIIGTGLIITLKDKKDKQKPEAQAQG
jgi:hypothetical protein